MKSLRWGLLGSLLVIFPLYGQNFEALLNELAKPTDADTDQTEGTPQGKLPPSSMDLLSPDGEEDPFAVEKNIRTNGAVLQGLDKLTGRVFITHARVGQTIKFGSLEIVLQRCEKAPLNDRQESMAFLKITESKPKAYPQQIFSGWMLASSPALSSFDHPAYDVWVKECKDITKGAALENRSQGKNDHEAE